MLRLPPFELRRPRTLAEAAAILTGEGAGEGAGEEAGAEAGRPAGGTDLWPNMKRRHLSAEVVVALSGIAELRGVRANGEVRIGATTTLTEVAAHPAVRERYPALRGLAASGAARCGATLLVVAALVALAGRHHQKGGTSPAPLRVTLDAEPWFVVEAKLSATRPDPALGYFRERLAIPWSYQVTLEGERDFVQDGVRVLPAHRFLGYAAPRIMPSSRRLLRLAA